MNFAAQGNRRFGKEPGINSQLARRALGTLPLDPLPGSMNGVTRTQGMGKSYLPKDRIPIIGPENGFYRKKSGPPSGLKVLCDLYRVVDNKKRWKVAYPQPL